MKRSRIGTGICDLLMQCPAVHDLSSRLDSGGLYQNAADLFHSGSDEIVRIEQLLWDAKSLMSYRSVRYAMLSQRGRSLRKTAQPMRFQYFDPTIPIRPEAYRYFADCGACNGDTIQSFCANLGAAALNELYAFEPDAYNESQLRLLCQKQNIENVKIYPIAVWDKPETLSFRQRGDSASCVSEEGDSRVSADTMDRVLAGKKVTFVKMDIEGAELAALRGASGLLQAQRPALAICIYHSPEDMIRIPQYIHSLLPDYFLFVRHYSKSLFGEAVCYALPPEYLQRNSN
ncbi:MAG: FkbM family methyltransferase [Eubacteriales bacterium]|nr:FkbM family methyltransferase [Eubacteriales bacterium]